ncbi:hypothetical protein DMN91_008278 [Ooceraea biroi]|uniref:Uncharacterized protein n=2 Tax=Ooceraea biroi TaxID=2015173 RepID=A0A3L8DHA4_OOCBI|nr:hypothetical protein DMN91_008278 [Ooceraea biroi]
MDRTSEDSGSPQSCDVERICSATSTREMTSVRTCYCKHETSVPCRKDNDVGAHKETRHPATPASKKSVIRNGACGNNEESRKMRSVINEKTLLDNRSVEVQPSDPVLSPETSAALENAAKIVGNAKIQLREICGTSRPDSPRRNINTYSDDPPLDDEAEELLYIRELVASKFHEASSSRCEDASGKASSGELPRARRVDLSAPKFRMSQRRRRRDDWSSLGYGDIDDRGSRERAPLTEVPPKDSLRDEDGMTVCDDRARDRRRASSSSAAERELVRARGNACRIQMGPSLHIVDRELTRQDLEDVHISPEPSRAQSHRANTATYVLRHDVAGSSTSAENEAEMRTRTPRTVLRARLGPLQREKRGRLIDFSADAAAAEAEKRAGDSASAERAESSTSRAQEYEEDQESDLRDTGGTRILERLGPAMNDGAANYAATADSETGNEKSKEKNGNQAEVTFSPDDTRSRYAEETGGGTSNKRSDIDKRAARRNPRDDGSAADEIREENQGDRSKPPFPPGDAPRKTGSLRRENITSMGSARAIDECLSNTYDSHSGQTNDEPRDDVAGENVRRRSFTSRDLRTKGEASEVDLYQPRLDDLDLILLSNEERLRRVTRAAENFVELLSRPEFARYRPDDGEQTTPRYAKPKEFYRESSADKKFQEEIPFARNESTRSSVLETELRNEDLTTETKSSILARETDRGRDDDAMKNSVEFSTYPASEASDGFGSPRPDEAQPNAEARLSDVSMDKSDATAFSNLLPALSSTRTTETQTCRRYRDEQIVQGDPADVESRVTAANRRDTDRSRKRGRSGDILLQVLHGLRDTSGSAADRFVTYILQDEKQSVERKVTSALKESAITPIAVQKLLDRLREVESARNAHQTETLGILKDILINAKSEAEEDAENINKHDKEISSSSHLANLSVRTNRTTPNETEKLISRKESPRQMRATADTSKVERITENFQDLKRRDNNSSNFSVNQDTRESVQSETRSSEATGGPKNNNRSKGDPYSEAESLKQISDIRSDDDEDTNSRHLSTKTASVKSSRTAVGDADVAIAASGDDAQNNKNLANQDANENIMQTAIDTRLLNISAEASSVAAREIVTQEAHDTNVALANKKGNLLAEISETKERVRSLPDASPAKSKLLGREVLKEKNVTFVHSLATEDVGSPCAIKTDSNSQHPVEKAIQEGHAPAKSCSADSPRESASSSSARNSESPLKETGSQTCFNIEGEDNSIKDTRDEAAGKPTTMAVIENGDFGLAKSAGNDAERRSRNTLLEYKLDILSGSNSSISSALLDHDNRYINGISGVKVKGVETASPETSSHSEGELYMPSSCSYSLGEVRVLRKRDLIADSTTDRDSSSVTSLLGSSGRV